MNINFSASVEAHQLHQSLVRLARADMARDYLCIRSKNQHGLSNIKVNQLHMGIILHGQQQLNIQTTKINLSAGQLYIVKPDTIIDAVNLPDPVTGEYLTILVPMCEEVIQAAQMIWAKPVIDKTGAILKFSIDDFATHLAEWQTALFDNDLVKARLCIASILVQLCQQHYSDVLILPPPKLAKIIHDWVIDNPEHHWQSSEIEMRLSVSSATLRRKLKLEETSLRETITHARLAYALELLYSNKLPMKTIAAKSGYQSVSIFRERFMQRYGVDPTVLTVE
ncbi:helix-turn-helix domain-containing protein [Acinetobacter calcoaceticus]|jgi:AraC-like DNA-binding protein|uniref:helix-turn-helix domain-containing protein n=1 Tax=Acinetobacter calcoaceticus TaxID=471 RepID=UPI00039D90D2|nr:AraC family transcriptional regulator [Acinetobacter calcoaceticus]